MAHPCFRQTAWMIAPSPSSCNATALPLERSCGALVPEPLGPATKVVTRRVRVSSVRAELPDVSNATYPLPSMPVASQTEPSRGAVLTRCPGRSAGETSPMPVHDTRARNGAGPLEPARGHGHSGSRTSGLPLPLGTASSLEAVTRVNRRIVNVIRSRRSTE